MRPILKKILHKKNFKRAGGVVQGVGPEFKPQHHEKKRKENCTQNTMALLFLTF
jgi:hypothetical protein